MCSYMYCSRKNSESIRVVGDDNRNTRMTQPRQRRRSCDSLFPPACLCVSSPRPMRHSCAAVGIADDLELGLCCCNSNTKLMGAYSVENGKTSVVYSQFGWRRRFTIVWAIYTHSADYYSLEQSSLCVVPLMSKYGLNNSAYSLMATVSCGVFSKFILPIMKIRVGLLITTAWNFGRVGSHQLLMVFTRPLPPFLLCDRFLERRRLPLRRFERKPNKDPGLPSNLL